MLYQDFSNLIDEEKTIIDVKDFEAGFFEKIISGVKLSLSSLMFLFNKKLYLSFLCEAILIMVFSFVFIILTFIAVFSLYFGIIFLQEGTQGVGIFFYIVAVFFYIFLLIDSIFMLITNFWYYDALRKVSDKTERIMFGIDYDVNDKPLCNGECFKFSCSFYIIMLMETAFVTIIMCFLFWLLYIPGINVLFIFLYASLIRGYITLKVLFLRKGRYWDLFKFWKQNFAFVFGLGLGSYFINHIPVIGNVLSTFGNAIAGTKFVVIKNYYDSVGGIRNFIPQVNYTQPPQNQGNYIVPQTVQQPIQQMHDTNLYPQGMNQQQYAYAEPPQQQDNQNAKE